MAASENNIDWTGVAPDRSLIAPLTAETFAQRLQLLTDRANSIDRLRQAFQQQHPHGSSAEPQPELQAADEGGTNGNG